MSNPLWAQPAPEISKRAARELTYQGIADLEAGNYAAALDKLERAYSVVQAPTVALYLARAYEKNDKLVEASERYLAASRVELGANASAAFREAKAEAERELEALRPRIPALTLRLEGAEASRVEVFVDGVALPSSLIGVEVPVNPGTRKIVASYGSQKLEASAVLREGEKKEVELRFNVEPNATKPEPIRPVAPATKPRAPGTPPGRGASIADRSGNTQAVLGWAALGVGGAGVIVGTAFGVDGLAKQRDLKDRCGGTRCPPSEQSAVDAFERSKTISTVGFVVAGVGLAAGVSLLLTADSGAGTPAARRSPAKPELRGWLGPASVGLNGRF